MTIADRKSTDRLKRLQKMVAALVNHESDIDLWLQLQEAVGVDIGHPDHAREDLDDIICHYIEDELSPHDLQRDLQDYRRKISDEIERRDRDNPDDPRSRSLKRYTLVADALEELAGRIHTTRAKGKSGGERQR